MTIDTSKLRGSTKGLMGTLLAAGAVFNVPEVHDFLIALAHNHPHVLALLGTVTGIAGLMHNPQVQEALGIKHVREVKDTTEEVELATPAKDAK